MLTDLLKAGDRVIDVGVTDATGALLLPGRGSIRYLGLALPELVEGIRAAAGEDGARIQPLMSDEQVTRNNADVLILRAPFARFLWKSRDLRHSRYVAVESTLTPAALEAHLAGLLDTLTGRYKARGRVEFAGRQFQLYEFPALTRSRPRQYLSEIWGVPGLVRHLEARGVSYAALRWFETLPAIEPGEDLDLLVADDQVAEARELLGIEPGTVPVDLYSASGLPGSDFRKAAYYQPNLAHTILERAVVHASGCRVPSPLDHLHSLAYHALYHKGEKSGLPSLHRPVPDETPDHDYGAVLREVAESVGVALPTTLEEIDEYLAEVGWRPSRDALRRLAQDNPWLRRHFFTVDHASRVERPEPAVFLVRERTLSVVSVEDIKRVLEDLAFDILAIHPLSDEERMRCAAEARGGNWDRGPFPVSGGKPTTAIFAVHYGPRTPDGALRARYPNLSNEDVLTAKLRIRDLVDERVAEDQRFNAVHSSDNDEEAWEYVAMAMVDEHAALRQAVEQRRSDFRTDVPVIAELSAGRRAKVELVERPGGPVVRKTYAPAYLRLLEREAQTIEELAPHVPAVPEIIDRGPDWIELPYYEGQLGGDEARTHNRLIPLPVLRAMIGVLRDINARGIDLVDVKPQNFLLDPKRGLKVIDFEFAHRYEGPVPDLASSIGFAGPPKGFTGDLPVSWSYQWLWKPFTGMPLEVLLNGSPVAQRVHRAKYRVGSTVRRSAGGLRREARTTRRHIRRSRRMLEDWGGRRARSSATGAA